MMDMALRLANACNFRVIVPTRLRESGDAFSSSGGDLRVPMEEGVPKSKRWRRQDNVTGRKRTVFSP